MLYAGELWTELWFFDSFGIKAVESQTQPAEIGGRFGQAIDRYGFDAIWWWYYAGTSLVLLLLFACPFVRHSPPVPLPPLLPSAAICSPQPAQR